MIDDQERERRLREALCLWCAVPLPEDAAYQRQFCGATCRQRDHRALKRAGLPPRGRKRRPAAAPPEPAPSDGGDGHRKRCSTCREVLLVDRFGRSRNTKDGLEGRCRECRSARHAATYVPKGWPQSLPQRQKYKPGHRFAALAVVERLGKIRGSMYVLCRCDCGRLKRIALQNLVSGAITDCADRDRHSDPRIQQHVTYSGAHNRIRAARGSASQYRCRCGKQGFHWAYTHSDYDERRDLAGREGGRPYSTKPAHYTPLCRTCHIRWDATRSKLPTSAPSLPHIALWLIEAEPNVAAVAL